MTTTTITNSPNIIIRFLWFLFIGLPVSTVWTAVAWVLCVSIIGLPFGLWMLAKLPFVTTLRGDQITTTVTANGSIQMQGVAQYPFLLRAIYFVFVGSWLSALWLAVAWLMSSIIIGLPLSFWMIDRVPAVLTLARS